jgi:hypothetical protein
VVRPVEDCEFLCAGARQDRLVGYRTLRLWTNHPLVAARRIYLAAGFVPISEEPHTSFGADLVGQTYELALTAPGAAHVVHPSCIGPR